MYLWKSQDPAHDAERLKNLHLPRLLLVKRLNFDLFPIIFLYSAFFFSLHFMVAVEEATVPRETEQTVHGKRREEDKAHSHITRPQILALLILKIACNES